MKIRQSHSKRHFWLVSALAAVAHFATPSAHAASIPNPSFEVGDFAVAPGYIGDNALIAGWVASNEGRTGVSPSGQPFTTNNGAFPDGTNVAFIQSFGDSNTLSTTISELNPGTYYRVTFRANRSTNSAPVNVSVSLNGGAFSSFSAPEAITGSNPFLTISRTFLATATTADLSVKNESAGNSVILLDDFQIVASALIPNPSFENETFTVAPGFASDNGGEINGWTLSAPGRIGLNNSEVSAFADNGIIPAGRNVAFIQSAGSASTLATTITGLTAGTYYRVSFRANSRAARGSDTSTHWALNGAAPTVFSVNPPVDSFGVFSSPYRTITGTFLATGSTADLSITNSTPGDSTLLVDDFQIVASALIPNPSFENETFTVAPGYASDNGGEINGWTLSAPARIGLNNSEVSAFADNGDHPSGQECSLHSEQRLCPHACHHHYWAHGGHLLPG